MAAHSSSPPRSRLGLRAWTLIFAAVLAVIVVGSFAYFWLNWPFSKDAVTKTLQQASSSKVTFGSFRSTYFPHPGCIAEHVVIYQGSRTDLAPLITIERLVIQSSIPGLLSKHVGMVNADGMQIVIPRQREHQFRSSSHAIIDKFIAKNVSLSFESHANRTPLEFRIDEGELRNVGGTGAVQFRVRLSNPKPPGEIQASGTFGPWVTGQAAQSRVSGQYKFNNADLGTFHGIAGILSSAGSFDGTLENIRVRGTTDTPDFQVTSNRHRVDLHNQFDAVVNGTNGNVVLQQVSGQLRRTSIQGKAEVISQQEKKGRTATADLCSKAGRIEDVFLLFIKAEHSPITGITNFCVHVTIPPGKERFLKKVELQGDFGIDDSNFTRGKTQQNVNKLSVEAEGGDDDKTAATVLSSLHGHVEIKGGSAEFSSLSFGIPGARANMRGTYNLITHQVDLHGTLRMVSTPSHMAHGPKALLMKFMDPFFKKSQGSEVPVKITGTYEKPEFGLDLHDHKQSKAAKRLRHLYQQPSKAKSSTQK